MNTDNLKSKLNTKITENSERKITMQETALATTTAEGNYLALHNNALEIIKENLKNQPLSYQLFDIIKSPSGGTTAFTVPTLNGDEMEKEIIGVILDYTTPRAYWETPEPVEGTPPVCFSADSRISSDGKACSQCAYNTFGSKDGDSNAKACKESVLLFVLRPDNIMPTLVRVPVSSKAIFQKYLTRLISKMMPISGVVTKITLEKATNKTGQPYAQYRFEMVEVLSPEEAASAKAFGKQFMEFLSASDTVIESTATAPEVQKAG